MPPFVSTFSDFPSCFVFFLMMHDYHLLCFEELNGDKFN